jgi:hypothetical protein
MLRHVASWGDRFPMQAGNRVAMSLSSRRSVPMPFGGGREQRASADIPDRGGDAGGPLVVAVERVP